VSRTLFVMIRGAVMQEAMYGNPDVDDLIAGLHGIAGLVGWLGWLGWLGWEERSTPAI
jgi:hypothetical protein